MKNICILLLCLLSNCIKLENEKASEILEFLNKKKYKYSVIKSDIPAVVVDSLSNIEEIFKIGDNTELTKISFSDVRVLVNGVDIHKYNKKLHFILLGDTVCLLVYREGGVGIHDVVDYVKYKGNYKHIRHETFNILDDTVKLGNFFVP